MKVYGFATPKPVELIERIIQISTFDGDIVLDSFAGSGTTGHAVLNTNRGGGKRQFILVGTEDYAESLTAERVRRVIDGYGDVAGTGGDFSFYELGEPLLVDGHNLNENVGVDKIRAYVYFMETKQPGVVDSASEPYLLGVHADSAYYFYYEKSRVTTLDYAFLTSVKTEAGQYVIYADINALDADILAAHNITFKKISRDISKL